MEWRDVFLLPLAATVSLLAFHFGMQHFGVEAITHLASVYIVFVGSFCIKNVIHTFASKKGIFKSLNYKFFN